MTELQPETAAGDAQEVLNLVAERTGLSFPTTRRDAALTAIRRITARRGASAAQYRDTVRSSAAALDELVAELTVGETYFFREPAHFEFVRQTILPELVREKGPDHILRLWSAACASGEEAYSLAIVLAESGLAKRSHVLATDISRPILAKARAGIYRDWSLRGAGAPLARRYLRKEQDDYRLDESVRNRVSFEYLNLALDVYPSFANGTWGLDLIFCRNVLIYFDPHTAEGVLGRLFAALAPGGWLITASSDPPASEHAPFEVMVTDRGLFYRRPLVASGGREPTDNVDTASIEPAAKVSQASPNIPDFSGRSRPVETTHRPAASAGRQPADKRIAAQSWPEQVREAAGRDSAKALDLCAQGLSEETLSVELHYLQAVLLLDLDRGREAVAAARHAVYLDRFLAVGHFTLGAALERLQDLAGARRAYRNAHQLCAARPADELVPLADGENAGRLAEAAAARLAVLDATSQGVVP